MIKQLTLFVLLALNISVYARGENGEDSVVFNLHKFEQHIGKETYHLTRTGNTLSYRIDFKFTDRGSAVPLKAKLVLTNNLEPVSLVVKGRSSRLSVISDSIAITGTTAHIKVNDSDYVKTVSPLSFPVAGYAPGTVQQELVRYWQRHNKPVVINTLPYGKVEIKRDGADTVDINGKPIVWQRFTIGGLIWGNELLWTDASGMMTCLITNDAEADKLEMMRSEYESLLPVLISRAAKYSMRLLARSSLKTGTSTKAIAITGGTLIDVVTGTTIQNAVIVIKNGTIEKAGEADHIAIPAGAQVIDATGKTILPGLWDMHAHFEQAEWGPAYLAVGVTTVRDCGNEFGYINAIKKAIDGGEGVGPEILKAGIIDGKGQFALGIIQADTRQEAIKAVDRYYNNGFVQIKIYSSVKPAVVKAICEEAHRLGLTVTGHIPDEMTVQAGVDSGMNMVNHIQYVASAMKHNKDRTIDFNDPASVAVVKFIKDHNVTVDPTMGVFELITRPLNSGFGTIEPKFNTLPLQEKTIFKNLGMDSVTALKYKPLYNSWLQLVKVLFDAGIPIVAGTDQGIPGYSLDRELELYVNAGLTPLQAIQTASIIPARVMKVDKQSGSVTAGKKADVVIVEGNPLKSIRDIRNVALVVKGGKIYDPVQLHHLVGFSE